MWDFLSAHTDFFEAADPHFVLKFYGTFRQIALNRNIWEITSERSVDLLQALIPLFTTSNWIEQPEDRTTIQDAIEENIEIRMISSDNVVVQSRFSTMESTAGPRDWLWFIEKGAIFSMVVNRIAEKCTVLFEPCSHYCLNVQVPIHTTYTPLLFPFNAAEISHSLADSTFPFW
ncbi:hypothetical protein M407DRAFT_3959 [Tulasnella calospora MUT 4182]|uniref:Uncharacterized protein n=1 Tax=Tulasnella calospora MUT 4182 TaxID=1051891 RepID=A0A0C3MIB1_9AGAM|nr:hypothetical protein M407DRAFT_3959 [Tulasnella calospora MUT 4182]